MAAKPSPSEHPSEREQDVIREIEQATGWPEPLDDSDREKPNGDPENPQFAASRLAHGD